LIPASLANPAFVEPFRVVYDQLLSLLPMGIRRCPAGPSYFTGYACGTMYDWDQYFEALVLLYAGYPSDYIRNGVSIFLDRQEESGFIGRSVPVGGGPVYASHCCHVKPFLAQELVLCLQADGSLEWLPALGRYERLRKYLLYWLRDLDVRGKGLSVWREAGHTGMDNHYERAGRWNGDTDFCEGVDLNVYLTRECRAMALIAQELDRAGDADFFLEQAALRAAAIQRFCWLDEDGMYYDYHARREEPIRVKYAGAFLPMWAGIPDSGQTGRLVERLLDPGQFWRPWPLPALAADEPGYVEGFRDGDSLSCCSWRAHVWAPVNYMAALGLARCGRRDLARQLSWKTWDLFLRGPFSEYYTSESGIGTGRRPFWGWTCLAPFMPVEAELGADPTEIDRGSAALGAVRAAVRAIRNVETP